MSSKQQLTYNMKRKKKIRSNRLHVLRSAPQKKAICQRTYICTPKKPNSAKRKVAKVKLSTGFSIIMYIPGFGAHKLQKYSTILVRAGKTQDLPGVKFKGIRGKYDFLPQPGRKNRRSKYGVKKPK